MAAHLNKLLIFPILLLLSCSVSSVEVPMGEKVLSIAVREVVKSTAELGEIIQKCKDKETKLEFTSLVLPEVDERTMLLALLYLSGKATDKCEGVAWAKFSHSLGNYNNVIQYYEIKDKQEFEYEILTNDVWRKYKLEIEYLELDENLKKGFESNQELHKSFDAMHLFKELKKSGRFTK